MVQDAKGRLIYTIKKKGFGGKFLLYDASGYELYTMTCDFKEHHPIFEFLLNDEVYMHVKCASRFVDPSIVAEGENDHYLLKSQDRLEFEIFKEKASVGTLKTQQMPNGDAQYALDIQDAAFDDVVPLFALCVDLSFAKYKK